MVQRYNIPIAVYESSRHFFSPSLNFFTRRHTPMHPSQPCSKPPCFPMHFFALQGNDIVTIVICHYCH